MSANKSTKDIFYEIIKNNNTQRKDTTINLYLKNLMKLIDTLNVKEEDINNLSFLNDTKSIDKYVNSFTTISTQRNIYTAILSLLNDKQDKRYLYYKLKETQLNNKQSKLYEQNKMNETKTEKYNQLSKSQIEGLLDNLLKNNEIQDYILLSLIYHYNYRNEISNLQVIDLKDFKRLTDTETKDNNYLVIGTKITKIVRFKYKTDKKYGSIENDIDIKKLKNIIKKYVKTLDSPYLFTNTDKSHYTNHQVSNRVRYITKKYLNIEVSPNLITKISLEEYSKMNNELKEKARIRGHSQAVQSKVYIQ